jgi:hypothetical protein
MEDKINASIKCYMEKNQESSQLHMESACYATMLKANSSHPSTPPITLLFLELLQHDTD